MRRRVCCAKRLRCGSDGREGKGRWGGAASLGRMREDAVQDGVAFASLPCGLGCDPTTPHRSRLLTMTAGRRASRGGERRR